MINRQLNHAIAELDRVQARRKAQPMPSIYTNKAKKFFSFIRRDVKRP